MIINKDGSFSEKRQAPGSPTAPFQYDIGKGLCRNGVYIYLNHSYGPGWKCKRCQYVLDIKTLLK